jgi:hypothetical protein
MPQVKKNLENQILNFKKQKKKKWTQMIFFRSEFHDFRRLRKSIVSIRGMLQMAADRQMDWHIPLLSYTVLYCTLPPKKERDNAVTEQKIVEWKTQIYKNIPARRLNFQLIMQLILKPFQKSKFHETGK